MKQVDRHSCAPTAIINALKWQGWLVNGSEYMKPLKKRLNTGIYSRGTKHYDVRRVIPKELGVVRELMSPTLKDIDAELNKGNALCISYCHPGSFRGHMIFCPGKTAHYYEIANHDHRKDQKALTRLSRKNLSRHLRTTYYDPSVWHLRRVAVMWVIERNM